MPNVCIIYRMRNGCLCWLLIFTVDIIKDWLPQVTESPFCAGIELGRCTAPRNVFSHMAKLSSGVLFIVSKVNAYSEGIWCTETLKTYHMYIFWHDQVWRYHLRHSTFFLKFISCVILWYKMSHLKCWRKVLRANQFYRNLPFISSNVSFKKTVSPKTSSWIFSRPNFFKNTIILDVSNGVNVRFEHSVHPTFQVLL